MRRLCCWLLERFLPPDVCAHVIGDLVEQGDRGTLWFCRETIAAMWHLGTVPRRRGDSPLTNVVSDLRFAARLLRRAPSFTIATVLTLGLAIGATTAIFSVVDPVLIRPLPYPDPGHLAVVWERTKDGGRDALGFATYRDLVEQSKTIERAAAVGSWAPTVMRGSDAERIAGDRVSWTYFRTLGVAPALGRDFLPEEDVPGKNQVVILSHALWQGFFGGDSSIIGNAITISGSPMIVVGVMPASFYNAASPDTRETNVQIWRVLGYANQPYACRTCHHLWMVARIRHDVSLAQAQREIGGIHGRLEREYPTEYASAGAWVVSLQQETTRAYRPGLLALGAAVLAMLLIAAANVINLQLARSVRREHEFAMRTALGAGRGRLARQLLVEGLLLAVLAGIAGVGVAAVSLPALIAKLPDQLPRRAAIHLDVAALGVAAGVVLLLAMVMGLVPATSRARDVASPLRSGVRVSGAARHGTRRTLVVAEITLAMMLLASAALLGKSFVRLLGVDVGFDPSHLLTLEINAIGQGYRDNASIFAYQDRVSDAVRALPGVERVALTNQLPLTGAVDMYGVLDPANMPANPETAPSADRYGVTPEYLRTMRIPLLEGRSFTAVDAADSANRVTLVSRSLARTLWPGQTAVGKRIRIGGPDGRDWTVIGVVGDVRHSGLDATVTRQWYYPRRQWFAESQELLVVRTQGDPLALAPAVRRAVKQVDATQPITWIVTEEQAIARSTAQRRLALVLFTIFALASLLLAVAGIYGVLAQTVAERIRELGVRCALGAKPGDIIALVVGQGGRMAGIGIVLGIVGSLMTTRFLRALLYDITPTDPATLVGVVLLLAAAALAACVIPARRAGRVDPATALRAE
jgi:putative ABC transport system permease protein